MDNVDSGQNLAGSRPIPRKSLGQHWLFDSKSLGAICDAAAIELTDTVLEVGPGLGTLTIELTQRAKQVIAVEFDRHLASQLPERVPASNLKVVCQDILKFNLATLPQHYKVVANIPYYLTSHLIRYLLESPTPPDVAVLLVQKEVAHRLAAQPGRMSVLAVSAQFYAHVHLGMEVTADKFDPPPKVNSQVVVLRHRDAPLFTDIPSKQFFRVVKAGFGEKRKTLRNSLSGGLDLPKTDIEGLLQQAAISPGARAEQLSLDDWHRLVSLI